MKEKAMNNSSLTQILINNHTEANRGLIREHILIEDIYGFCKSFENQRAWIRTGTANLKQKTKHSIHNTRRTRR